MLSEVIHSAHGYPAFTVGTITGTTPSDIITMGFAEILDLAFEAALKQMIDVLNNFLD